VNTIIIEEADRFGLAQLYQMRGRVGRSTRVGYAYLTYRYDKNLTEEASRRLQAIKEFTELGSGFKIAMRDLEIRGAGNVLGAEQHGFMLEVGFDLYCQMLEEAVARLKGKPQSRRVESEIKISIDAFIPDYYIPEAGQKLAMYKRLAALNDPGDLEDVLDELIDRYGAPPRSVLDLIAVTRLRISASQAGVASVNEQRSEWVVQFIPDRFVEPAALQKLPAEMLRRIQLRPGGAAFRFSWAIAGEPASVCAENLAKFLGLVTEGFHHGEDALMGSNADSIPG
jgi:transcription-repair coupling factor (superfamily II helicase)